jgi:hypothetical protein
MTNAEDLLRALAAANPVPEAGVATPGKTERDALLDRIYEEHPRRLRRTRSRRLLVAGLSIVIAATAIPAAALSGRLSSLFEFSNQGTSDVPEAEQLNNVRVADRLGLEPGSTVRLAERSGVVFYTVRGESQRQCFGYSAGPDVQSERFTALMCPSPDGPAVFPSSTSPILDMSPHMGRLGSNRVHFPKIIGFAADGVAEVGIVDLHGRRHTTPVESNVYVAENLADVPAQAQIAVDTQGDVVWRREVKALTLGKADGT